MNRNSLCMCLFALCPVVACVGGSGGDTTSATDGPDDSSSDGGSASATDTGAAGGCVAPAGATVLADWAPYGDDDSVLREIAFDPDTVYFHAGGEIYGVAQTGGGVASSIYDCPGDLASLDCSLWQLAGDDLLVLTNSGAVDLTGNAIAYPAWVDRNGLAVLPSRQLVLPDGSRVGKYDVLDENFQATQTDWVILQPGAAMADPQAAGVGGGGNREIYANAAALWTNANSSGGIAPDPDEIWMVDFDGTIGPVAIDKPGELILATDAFLYFIRDRTDVIGERGVWRAPTTGGNAELVGPVVPFYGDAKADGGKVVIAEAGTIWAIDDVPGATLVKVIDLPVVSTLDASCTNHGLGVRDGEVYSSMFDEAAGEALVFKVALP